jgi:putative glycosyltransferase (TIGR04348 family)
MHGMAHPRVLIVTPASAQANNGNWHTAARWQRFLGQVAQVEVAQRWEGQPADALIALHARRSADSIARFRAARPQAPLALVLTGTDLYRDLDTDLGAQHSLECASHLVVLQPAALRRLMPGLQAKARSIVQSADALPHAAAERCDFVAVGHLREEKDPATLMRAAQSFGDEMHIAHIGSALDPALGEAARRTAAACASYRWLGALPPDETRGWIAAAGALVHMSRIEGGANVVIEAVRSGTPVLASRIDGNVGLLGEDYGGYFPAGDAQALAALMQRFRHDADFADGLRAQCAQRGPLFRPEAEAAAVQTLLADMLATTAPTMAPTPTDRLTP